MHRGLAHRWLRKALLAYARRQPPEQLLAGSQRAAWRAVQRAARCSQAYRELLREQGIAPGDLVARVSWQQLPVLTKANTFERFGLAPLARPVAVQDLADVLTSSGRGGGPGFGFRLSTRKQHDGSWFDIDLGLQDVFGVDDKPTLLVNCLPMGVVFSSRAVTVANVSVREDMACAILRDLGPRFAQTVVCTDPLFVRQLLRRAQELRLDWRALNTSMVLGEEMLVEPQREHIAAHLGIELGRENQRLIGSSFGVGELGLNLLFETRETIALRRALRSATPTLPWLARDGRQEALPSVFCHNPLRCHLEVLQPDAQGWGELCFTMLDREAVIPLPRYTTGDLGRLLPPAEARALCRTLDLPTPWLPVVLVRGRLKDRPPGLPSVEQVKEWVYRKHAVADRLSGAFKLQTLEDGRCELVLQPESGKELLHESACLETLRDAAAQAGYAGLLVRFVTPQDPPWGPPVDHERKFRYNDLADPR
jgi:phenylacetate-CoA ligase